MDVLYYRVGSSLQQLLALSLRSFYIRFTNNYNLPQPVYDALLNNSYEKGHSNISITDLIDSPKVVALRNAHEEDLVADVTSMMPSLMGQAVHTILERAAISSGKGKAEERLYMDVELPDGNTWVVSGQYDYIDEEGVLWDWKNVSVKEYLSGLKESRERQLNCYAYLASLTSGITITDLRVCVIMRDWSQIRALTDRTYPSTPIITVSVPKWPDSVTKQYIQERCALHYVAQQKVKANLSDSTVELPECSIYERWEDPTKYAATKKGSSKASRLFSTRREAEEYVRDQQSGTDNYNITERPSEATRCKYYCAVLKYCSQGQQLIAKKE